MTETHNAVARRVIEDWTARGTKYRTAVARDRWARYVLWAAVRLVVPIATVIATDYWGPSRWLYASILIAVAANYAVGGITSGIVAWLTMIALSIDRTDPAYTSLGLELNAIAALLFLAAAWFREPSGPYPTRISAAFPRMRGWFPDALPNHRSTALHGAERPADHKYPHAPRSNFRGFVLPAATD
jgi:hypothetical protein